MKIGVNARFLTKPFTGIGLYTKELFWMLATRHPEVEFVLVVPNPVQIEAPPQRDFAAPPNLSVVVLRETMVGTGGMRKTFWEQVQVPRFFLQHNVDLAHFPYPSNPWRRFSKPCVVTVHDTIPWTMKAYRRNFSTRLYQDRCCRAVAKADRVLTVSRVSQIDIMETCDVPAERITVTPNALPAGFTRPFDQSQREQILAKYDLSPKRPFFFYLGGYDERKNVELLADVFLTKIAPRFDVDLVLGGGKLHHDRLYKSYDSLTDTQKVVTLQLPSGQIRATGFIDPSDLPALYQSCFAFVNLSRKEGFNIPLLEAAASGVPVIASDIPVHREVLGDYGLYVPPDDADATEKLLRRLLEDSAFYHQQKHPLAQFRNPFSWEQTADTVLNLYKTILCS